MKVFCAGIGAGSLAILAVPVQGADFYSGKTIRCSVGASAASGFTLVTRVLAEHFKKHIPGHPNMLVELKLGAGGAKAMDYILNAVAKDGTFIGAVPAAAVVAPLLRKLRYDSTKAAWLGSVTPMPEVSSVWHTAPVRYSAADAESPFIKCTTQSRCSVLGSSGADSKILRQSSSVSRVRPA